MKYSNIIFFLGALSILSACHEDSDQKGCTDPIAVNYEPRALREDGTCTYNQDEQVFWSNGVRGGWNGNLFEGAYRHEVCEGSAFESIYLSDSTGDYRSLQLSTDGGYKHMSYFTLINEHDARDFAEGTLRFDCRIVEGAAPEYIELFISGKNMHQDCSEYRRSTSVEISTHAFNDSTFTPVSIPIRHFDKLMMARVEVVCGMMFDADRNMGIELDNIRWSANQDPDPLPPVSPPLNP